MVFGSFLLYTVMVLNDNCLGQGSKAEGRWDQLEGEDGSVEVRTGIDVVVVKNLNGGCDNAGRQRRWYTPYLARFMVLCVL